MHDYYPGGMIADGCNVNFYSYGYQGSMKDREIYNNENLYTTEYRELDSRINRWWSRDPKAAVSPWSSPYVVNGNNPIIMIDPKGDKEYESMEAYTEATGNTELGEADWLTSDRKDNTSVWKNANSYNLKQEKGYDEYVNIEQRASFYSWFQETNSKGTSWAGAASKVAFAINELANPSMFGMNLPGVADYLGYSSEEARSLSNTGNRMIFEDAFPKLRTLSQGDVLSQEQAKTWDGTMLSQEQNLIQPLYEKTSALGLLSASSKQLLLGAGALAWWKNISIPPFPEDGNLLDVKQRWSYGMKNMGYNVVPSDMPPPGADYTNGAMYLKFRKAGAGGTW